MYLELAIISAMPLQAGMLDENPTWEKLEAWLRSSRGQLPMLVVFETAEDVLIHEDSAEARNKSPQGADPCLQKLEGMEGMQMLTVITEVLYNN